MAFDGRPRRLELVRLDCASHQILSESCWSALIASGEESFELVLVALKHVVGERRGEMIRIGSTRDKCEYAWGRAFARSERMELAAASERMIRVQRSVNRHERRCVEGGRCREGNRAGEGGVDIQARSRHECARGEIGERCGGSERRRRRLRVEWLSDAEDSFSARGLEACALRSRQLERFAM